MVEGQVTGKKTETEEGLAPPAIAERGPSAVFDIAFSEPGPDRSGGAGRARSASACRRRRAPPGRWTARAAALRRRREARHGCRAAPDASWTSCAMRSSSSWTPRRSSRRARPAPCRACPRPVAGAGPRREGDPRALQSPSPTAPAAGKSTKTLQDGARAAPLPRRPNPGRDPPMAEQPASPAEGSFVSHPRRAAQPAGVRAFIAIGVVFLALVPFGEPGVRDASPTR
ncbi:MAG: hypothetical protein MZV65_29540 [Chromatiales bacterium]|nr:hypothetical protein [Chromatiales bacterium]